MIPRGTPILHSLNSEMSAWVGCVLDGYGVRFDSVSQKVEKKSMYHIRQSQHVWQNNFLATPKYAMSRDSFDCHLTGPYIPGDVDFEIGWK